MDGEWSCQKHHLVPCNSDNITSISYSILHGNLFDTDDDGRKDGTATAQSVADIACGGCPTGQGAADAGSGEVLFAGWDAVNRPKVFSEAYKDNGADPSSTLAT